MAEVPFKPKSLPQFDIQRQQTAQRIGASGQGQQEALARRQAQLGNLNSGAAIKQSQNINNAIARQGEDAQQSINAQEAGIISQQTFQDEQSQKGRDFQAGESALQRKQQEDQFGKTFGEQVRQAGFAEKIGQGEFDLSKQNSMFNTALAYSQLKNKDAFSNSWDMQYPKEKGRYASGKKGQYRGGSAIYGSSYYQS